MVRFTRVWGNDARNFWRQKSIINVSGTVPGKPMEVRESDDICKKVLGNTDDIGEDAG